MTLSTSRPDYTGEDPATKRARVLAQLDLERSRVRLDPMIEFDRRLERIEATLAMLAARLDDAEGEAAWAAERVAMNGLS